MRNLRYEEYQVYVGRSRNGMHFGNPFSHKQDTLASVQLLTREAAVRAYEDWLLGVDYLWLEQERREWILQRLPTLKGRSLGCYCSPLACHADVLAKLAEGSKIG